MVGAEEAPQPILVDRDTYAQPAILYTWIEGLIGLIKFIPLMDRSDRSKFSPCMIPNISSALSGLLQSKIPRMNTNRK